MDNHKTSQSLLQGLSRQTFELISFNLFSCGRFVFTTGQTTWTNRETPQLLVSTDYSKFDRISRGFGMDSSLGNELFFWRCWIPKAEAGDANRRHWHMKSQSKTLHVWAEVTPGFSPSSCYLFACAVINDAEVMRWWLREEGLSVKTCLTHVSGRLLTARWSNTLAYFF